MIGSLAPVIPHIKALHIVMLALWCAGLFALPMMLARHDPAVGQADYARIRKATHYGYIMVVTPAALVAIISGTALVFLREAFVPWMFAKLVFVAVLVAFHAWVGHVLVTVAETEGIHNPPRAWLPSLLLATAILAILTLVLAKPELETIAFPQWLTEPGDSQLPFDVPRR
ncbi:MAG: CopD family protein [Rhizobium sp.]|nr:CopD family protein [Rhizobium sp.]